MPGPVHFDQFTNRQQYYDDHQNFSFLRGQAVHRTNIVLLRQSATPGFNEWPLILRFPPLFCYCLFPYGCHRPVSEG